MPDIFIELKRLASLPPRRGRRFPHHITEREFGRWIPMTGAGMISSAEVSLEFGYKWCAFNMIHWSCCVVINVGGKFVSSCSKMLPESPAVYKRIQCWKFELHRKCFRRAVNFLILIMRWLYTFVVCLWYRIRFKVSEDIREIVWNYSDVALFWKATTWKHWEPQTTQTCRVAMEGSIKQV